MAFHAKPMVDATKYLERIEQLASNDKYFKDELQRIIAARRILSRPSWFQERCESGRMNTVAYFRYGVCTR